MTKQTPLDRAREDLILIAAGARTVTADLLAEPIRRLETEAATDGRPSRFRATPAQVDAYLRTILAEDTYLRYQQAIGAAAVSEAVADADALLPDTPEGFKLRAEWERAWLEGKRDVLNRIDSAVHGGPYPSDLADTGDAE